ncbi:serine-rich adhesin for platelets [Eurosta solidaginis]|uniref:serine-rich adhesin for platelets n=1 Tax=Eurosta solidaginis TaxID=178769 RepID=UPI0035309EB1
MPSIFAGIHLQDKPNEFLPLDDVDFEHSVHFLKEEIARKLQYDATKLEIIFNGLALKDESKLLETLRPNATVHCFSKTKQNSLYVPPADVSSAANISRIHELFNVIAHTQINVNSRVNILQKILAEYPEFRRNLGAQALIRDSVLFNTLHHPQVVKSISETYPIICEAAPFMVDTIKKELARSTSTTLSEPATDSTNSSEEENSMGATTSNERTESGAQSENGRIRMISRQQLQAALARIDVGSVNSLSNIAQRNSDAITTPGSATDATSETASVAAATTTATAASTTSTPLANSASGERFSAMFRTELQRALESLSQRHNQVNNSRSSTSTATGITDTQQQQMDTTESSSLAADNGTGDNTSDADLPPEYRSHQYASQLRTMAQMGLLNYEDNIAYLTIASGSIENAVNLLMGGMN